MRILADENVRADIVDALRTSGHDVRWVLEDGKGAIDADVLRRSVDDERLLVTLDKGDFGRLIFQNRQAAYGIIVVRIAAPSPHELIARLVQILHSRDDWPGYFWTLTETRIRRRRLP